MHNAVVHCASNLPSALHSVLLYNMSPVPTYWYVYYIGTCARTVRSTVWHDRGRDKGKCHSTTYYTVQCLHTWWRISTRHSRHDKAVVEIMAWARGRYSGMAASVPVGRSTTPAPMQSISVAAQQWLIAPVQATKSVAGCGGISRESAPHALELYWCDKPAHSPFVSRESNMTEWKRNVCKLKTNSTRCVVFICKKESKSRMNIFECATQWQCWRGRAVLALVTCKHSRWHTRNDHPVCCTYGNRYCRGLFQQSINNLWVCHWIIWWLGFIFWDEVIIEVNPEASELKMCSVWRNDLFIFLNFHYF